MHFFTHFIPSWVWLAKFKISTTYILPVKRNVFIFLFERAFKVMKNGVYFIVIALLVAELFMILIYAN